MLRSHHPPPRSRVGGAWAGAEAPRDRPGRLRQDHWVGAGRPGDRWLHHESPVWEKTGPSPAERRKGGLKRSGAPHTGGVPVGIGRGNRHDSPLLEPTIEATKQQVGTLPEKPVMHLDSG